jgi:hypothetical protein
MGAAAPDKLPSPALFPRRERGGGEGYRDGEPIGRASRGGYGASRHYGGVVGQKGCGLWPSRDALVPGGESRSGDGGTCATLISARAISFAGLPGTSLTTPGRSRIVSSTGQKPPRSEESRAGRLAWVIPAPVDRGRAIRPRAGCFRSIQESRIAYKYRGKVSILTILSAESSPSPFPLPTHRSTYPGIEFPASLALRYLPPGHRRPHL